MKTIKINHFIFEQEYNLMELLFVQRGMKFMSGRKITVGIWLRFAIGAGLKAQGVSQSVTIPRNSREKCRPPELHLKATKPESVWMEYWNLPLLNVLLQYCLSIKSWGECKYWNLFEVHTFGVITAEIISCSGPGSSIPGMKEPL